MSGTAIDAAAVGAMVSVVGSYVLESLLDGERRAQHKRQCAERLMTSVASGRRVESAEQVLLANLDWGIESLDEAIEADDWEERSARLDHAEQMFEGCALLDARGSTAGVPNSYLLAWTHLNLAFVWKLRGHDRKVAEHTLEMFLIDPFYSRVDFAPALWEHLFLPHLPNVVSWYSRQRQAIVTAGKPGRRSGDETERSFSRATSVSSDSSAAKDLQVNVLNFSADQTGQLLALEKLYQDSLDENSRKYASYYQDWLTSNPAIDEETLLVQPTTSSSKFPAPPGASVPEISEAQGSAVADGREAGNKARKQNRLSASTSSVPQLQQFNEFLNPEFVGHSNDLNGASNGDSECTSPAEEIRFPDTSEFDIPGKTVTTDQRENLFSSLTKLVSSDENTTMNSRMVAPRPGRLKRISKDHDPADERLPLCETSRPGLPLQSASPSRRKGRLGHAGSLGAVCTELGSPNSGVFLGRMDSNQPPEGASELDDSGEPRRVEASTSWSSRWNKGTSLSKGARLEARSKSDRYHTHERSFRGGGARENDAFGDDLSANSLTSDAEGSEFYSQASTISTDVDTSDDSSDCEDQSAPIQQEPTWEPREKGLKDAEFSVPAASPLPPGLPLRFVPRYRNDEATISDLTLEVESSHWEPEDHREDNVDSQETRAPNSQASPVQDYAQAHTSRLEVGSRGRSRSAYDNADSRECGGGSISHDRGKSWGSLASSTGDSTKTTRIVRPPKDFVCPITSQLFDDPVTLETGQTYERKAIQEWLHRGNMSCPITRQLLSISSLPKTNYVLKRLVDSWKDQHEPDLGLEFDACSLFHGDSFRSSIELSKFKSLPPSFLERLPLDPLPSSESSPVSMESSGQVCTARQCSYENFARGDVSDPSSPSSPSRTEGVIMDIKRALTCLCLSDDLADCEAMIMDMAGLFQEAKADKKMMAVLNEAGVVHGLIDVLSNSTQMMVLSAILFLLSGLLSTGEMTRDTVVGADPEVGFLSKLLRKGFSTLSVVVLYQLKLPVSQLMAMDLLPLLVVVLQQSDENRISVVGRSEHHDLHSLIMSPKTAAVMLLEQIVTGGDQANRLHSVQLLLALRAAPALISCLDQARELDEKASVVSILLCCMQADGRSRNAIAQMSDFCPAVELLQSGNNRARTIAISFLENVVRINRRALCTSILRTVKTEGLLSTMHVVLVHLQTAPLETKAAAASLLLQLDLLDAPRGRSIYRDEAVESLVEALTSTECAYAAGAATLLIALGGRFSQSGKPMMEAWLLKIAGLDEIYLSFMKEEQESTDYVPVDQGEEEKAADLWERRVAGALVGHDLGILVEALGQRIQSKRPGVSKPCMVVATWLMHLLPKLADTGVRQTARNCLLDHFVGVLQTSNDLQQRVLAALAIHSFISDPDGIQELLRYMMDISGPLRQLKKFTWVAQKILRSFTAHADPNSPDLWMHAEQGQLDSSANGQVRALVRTNSRIFSGHSDGTIKVWDARKKFPVLFRDHKEHSKSVTALSISLNSDRMYSGSLDKTIRVWALGPEHIRCVHVLDMKEAITGVVVNGSMACIVPQYAGIKLQFEETATKTLLPSKHVRSVTVSADKVFCGCTDNSVQEVDPVSGQVRSVQHGVRTLLAKRSVYAIQVYHDYLYAAGSPIDGVAGKVWKASDFTLVGTLNTAAEVRCMAVCEDFIYLGSSTGVIEVWLRQRLSKVTTLHAGSKVMCLMHDGDSLYSGSEDGKIRVWTTTC